MPVPDDESNKLPVATFEQLLSNFLATSCLQQVEGNMLPEAALERQVAFNMLKATCCSKVATGNKLLSTCLRQLVDQKLLKSCRRQQVAFNKLLSTC